MQVLFVHGMGRSPLSAWPLLRQLKRAGLHTETFAYAAWADNFTGIQNRLLSRVSALAVRGDYVLVGHSLGGLLLRAALQQLPPDTRKPDHLFLLGSPIQPAYLAQKFSARFLYRLLTRDCGQFLGSAERMAAVGASDVRTTGIAGVRSLPWQQKIFGSDVSDGVVSLAEVSADWLHDQVQIETMHTWLPASRRVGEIILQRIENR